MKRTLLSLVLGSCLALSVFAQQRSLYQQTDIKGEEIGKLTGDTYYARMDDYVSVFMVTPDGIVLVEPDRCGVRGNMAGRGRWRRPASMSR